jgi:uncharacterized protein YjaZ
MDINIVTTFDNAESFMLAAEHKTADVQELWQNYMIEPYWADITKWAPFDQSFKKPQPIRELAALKEQLPILSRMSIRDLKTIFSSAIKALPLEDSSGEPMSVFLYPACDRDENLKKRQNGVVGTVVFWNIMIHINPLADKYHEWITFVFAHEYHHNVWGYHHFVLGGGRDCDGSFLEYMITEGQADLFAESLFPKLIPQWNRPLGDEAETALWNRIKPILACTDPQIHSLYMFGNETKGLPWCVGYSFGRMIVSDYINKHPDITFSNLIAMPAQQILQESKYRHDTAL